MAQISHFPVFSEDVTFTHHFMGTHLPPLFHPIGMLVILATLVKNYLKWCEIQLDIQCTVDTVNYIL